MIGNVSAARRRRVCRVARSLTLVVWALLGTAARGGAQVASPTGSVAGRVTDERGTAVVGADVAIVGGAQSARTGTNGSYVIENVRPGAHTVRARLIGYRGQTASVTVAAGQRATHDFSLAADPLNLEAVVVTGTTVPRTKLDASQAVTVLSAADLERAAPRSTTELLRYVPGFTRVESSGGEVNQNISMRGILGVEYVAFMEDGLPVFPAPHTFFMNSDNLFRPDENIERVEVVRGGASALYGSNTPGAIINFINKTGGPQVGGTVKASGATEGLARYDFDLNGPLGQDWQFNLGGFYRFDHGVRDPGYPGIRGGQLKFNVTRQLPNGYVRASLKYIDDRNQFILPLPLQNTSDPQYVPGFSNYGSMNTNEGLNVNVPIPTGRLTLPLDDGLRTKATWLTGDVSFDFAGGWNVRNSVQVMQDQQGWNAIVNGDRFGTAAKIDSAAVAQAGLTGVDSVQLFFTNHFDAPGVPTRFDTQNGLLAFMGEWHVDKPLTSFQDQLEVKKSFDRADVSFAAYFANYTQGNTWYFTDILTDVRDNPRFVDIVAWQGLVPTDVTKGGFRHFLSNYRNADGQTSVFSGVGSASVRVTDRLRVDLGARYEYNDFVQSVENTKDVDLDGFATTPYDLETFGDGTFRHLQTSISDWAASVGMNYKVNEQVAVYLQGSRGFKMPELDEFTDAKAQEQVNIFKSKRVWTGEGGVKLSSKRYSLTVNGFYSLLQNITSQGAVVDPITGRITWVIRTSPENRSYGAEVEASATPIEGLTVLANGTLLKAELGSGAGADIGSWINGVPSVIGNVAATYSKAAFTLLGDFHFVGRRYSDVTVGTTLPTYGYFNFGATYALPRQSITLSADLLNAFQSKGLEEGNPRTITGSGGSYFFARPILPRRFQAGIAYRF